MVSGTHFVNYLVSEVIMVIAALVFLFCGAAYVLWAL